MTDQEYVAEQARLRAITNDEEATKDEIEEAKGGLKALVKHYQEEHPTLVGSIQLPQT